MGNTQVASRPTAQTVASPAALAAVPATRWQSPFALALGGCLLLWAALPPVGWGLLAFLAPVPWVVLIRGSVLAGRRPYLGLWFASFLFHLASLYWVTLPHWSTSIGWLALSAYLAIYFPLFVGLSRVAVHAMRMSVLLAAPLVWVGLELLKAHLISGFAMGSLSHALYHWPQLLQTSDLAGGYGVSFFIVFVAACLARLLPGDTRRWAWWPLAPLGASLAAALVYGNWRMAEQTTEPGPKIALIQGSIDIQLKHDPSQRNRIFDEYFSLSREAIKKEPALDLIVWPETMYRDPWFVFDDDFRMPPDVRQTPQEVVAESHRGIHDTVTALGTPCLLGIDTVHWKVAGMDHYNTALLVDRAGQVRGRYDKQHLVPFGEYVPLADRFPWLYRLTPLPGGSTPGAGPRSFEVAGVRCAPNICYENTLPHVIRSQVTELRAAGDEPRVLINLTNDGWYWGSSELDMHLACAVFRAIESRKPFLVAANTGFSAWIDSSGRILAQGPRQATDVIIADVQLDHRISWYSIHGDLPAGLCLALCGGLAAVGLVQWRRQQKSTATAGI